MSPDDLIFNFRASSHGEGYDDGVWTMVIRHVVEQLSRVLGQTLSLVGDRSVVVSDGFSVDFRSEGVGSKPWQLGLRGIVGAQVIEDALLVRAWVYPYFGDVRLSAAGRGDVALLRYVRQDQGGVWISNGWEFEEHDESPAFEHFEEE